MYRCFRGSINLPSLYQLSLNYNLNQVHRIRNRSKPFLKRVEESKNVKLIKFAIEAEKKIERKLRSKSELDSLFELCQLAPWRGCHRLWVKKHEERSLIYLDFKNFYPSILCSSTFPNPSKLKCYKPKTIPTEPGIVRVIMHPKDNLPERVREIHPFLLQSSLKGCPFYLDNNIETIIHTNESNIWSKYFDLEPIEAITSVGNIQHPLKTKIIGLLTELEELRTKDPKNPKIRELKLFVNCATTTPKIGQSKMLPSPFGVHCLSSQIVSNGKALLFDAIHSLLEIEQTDVLQINTDGFLLQYPDSGGNINEILTHQLIGVNPGQLSVRAKGDAAFLLGPNTWWLTQKEEIICELGTGREQKELNTEPVPTTTSYADPQGNLQKINLLHLADYRHRLESESGIRKKFRITEAMRQSPLTPFILTEKEKRRSWSKTEKEFKKFREANRH